MQGFPVLYDKRVKGFKEKDAVQNTWEKVAESLDFEENGNFLEQVAPENILRVAVLKNLSWFCARNSYKILANQFDFRRCYFRFR